ncbi:MAG: peptidoglycan editing factor PgeF [Nitrococcus mobilis]|nr:peptidoglycan editing factor PgeF [Nitrococcus mobilis]
MSEAVSWLIPDWPAPAGVRAVVTTRRGGVSQPPYASFNLGVRTGDCPEHVAENRRRLRSGLALPEEPRWLHQVHGVGVVAAEQVRRDITAADAVWTMRAGVVCAIQTADCLPVFFCDRNGRRVALVHAGWRGLVAGVIEAAQAALGVPGACLLAWLGPAIGAQAFEVGSEVRAAFVAADPGLATAFRATAHGRWLADLYRLARHRLRCCGVERVYGGGFCTVTDARRFYSYRRDGRTGRMASLIWLA